MDIGSMGLANIVGEPLPPVLVELGQVSLVLGVHDVHRATAKDYNVGDEMAQASMRRVRPLDGEDGFPPPPNTHYSTIKGGLSSNESFDVVLPELFKMKRPCDPIHLASTAKPSLVSHPPECFQATPKRGVEQRVIECKPVQLSPTGCSWCNIAHTLQQIVRERE